MFHIILSYLSVCAFAVIAARLSVSRSRGTLVEAIKFIFVAFSFLNLFVMCVYTSINAYGFIFLGLLVHTFCLSGRFPHLFKKMDHYGIKLSESIQGCLAIGILLFLQYNTNWRTGVIFLR